MFYVALTFIVLRIRLQKLSPPVETTLNVNSFLAFLIKGVSNSFIHSVGGRDGMGFTVGMVSPPLLRMFACPTPSLLGTRLRGFLFSSKPSRALHFLDVGMCCNVILFVFQLKMSTMPL